MNRGFARGTIFLMTSIGSVLGTFAGASAQHACVGNNCPRPKLPVPAQQRVIIPAAPQPKPALQVQRPPPAKQSQIVTPKTVVLQQRSVVPFSAQPSTLPLGNANSTPSVIRNPTSQSISPKPATALQTPVQFKLVPATRSQIGSTGGATTAKISAGSASSNSLPTQASSNQAAELERMRQQLLGAQRQINASQPGSPSIASQPKSQQTPAAVFQSSTPSSTGLAPLKLNGMIVTPMANSTPALSQKTQMGTGSASKAGSANVLILPSNGTLPLGLKPLGPLPSVKGTAIGQGVANGNVA